MNSTTWRLKKGEDIRVRAGHPWVYSNELQGSPKGIAPGAWIELQDASGQFLAWGSGNAHSLIAFRVVSRDLQEGRSGASACVSSRLEAAFTHRKRFGRGVGSGVSARLVFGESDGLSGLVIDRFVLIGQVLYVVQSQTAAAESWLGTVTEYLAHVEPDAAILLRRDASVRKLEGLEVHAEPQLLRGSGMNEASLREATLLVPSVSDGTLRMQSNLWDGQKTGYFLDQLGNIEMTARLLSKLKPRGSALRILDLFSYVGQWSAQLTQFARTQWGAASVSSVIVDASREALHFAEHNARAAGADVKTVELDIVEKLRDWTAPRGQGPDPEFFDVIVVDPPALIKNRKAHGPGKHAYVQVNSAALALARPGTLYVSCSCSALLSDSDFAQVLAKAQARSGRKLRLISRGGPALDHPLLAQFPEGHYLKAWIGIVE